MNFIIARHCMCGYVTLLYIWRWSHLLFLQSTELCSLHSGVCAPCSPCRRRREGKRICRRETTKENPFGTGSRPVFIPVNPNFRSKKAWLGFSRVLPHQREGRTQEKKKMNLLLKTMLKSK